MLCSRRATRFIYTARRVWGEPQPPLDVIWFAMGAQAGRLWIKLLYTGRVSQRVDFSDARQNQMNKLGLFSIGENEMAFAIHTAHPKGVSASKWGSGIIHVVVFKVRSLLLGKRMRTLEAVRLIRSTREYDGIGELDYFCRHEQRSRSPSGEILLSQ